MKKKSTLKHRILKEMLTRFTVERTMNKTWWVLKDNFEIIADCYNKKNAILIRDLLSQNTKEASSR